MKVSLSFSVLETVFSTYEAYRSAVCPFTLWVFNHEQCHCDYRLGIFKLLIYDFVQFMDYREFDPLYTNENFERVYRNIPDAHLIVPNVDEEPEEIAERVYRQFPNVH